MASASSARRATAVAAVLGRFLAVEGLGEAPVGHVLIEAFVSVGLRGRAPSTRGTYRSVLRQGAPGRPPRAKGFPPSPARPPYSGPETAELLSVATSQKGHWRRSSALSFLALGIGAGLRPGELASAAGTDILASATGVSVEVHVGTGRVVPVGEPWAKILAGQAEGAGAGHMFCPGKADRRYKNFVNNFCYQLGASPGAPKFSSGRARSTFACSHLAAGTPLRQLLYIAGISEVESLLRYARHVPGAPVSKAELRRRLAEG
jgi:integrase